MPASNGDRKGVRFAVQDGMEEGEGGHLSHRRRGPSPPPPALAHPARHRGTSDGGDEPSSSSPPLQLPSSQTAESRPSSKKRPRSDYNVDEIDDVDDWRPEDDAEGDDDENDNEGGFGGAVLSEKALLEAKRIRRLRRASRLKNGDELDDDDDDEEEESSGAAARARWGRGVGASLLDEADADDNDGVPITPFNMDQEENDGDGYFDGDTYVFRHRRGGGGGADDEEPDAWADASDDEFNEATAAVPKSGGSSAFGTRSAAAAAAAAAATESVRRGPNYDEWTEQELLARIVPLVSDTETVTAAIVRYGSLIRHQQSKRGAGAAADARQTGTASAAASSSSSLRAQEALNELTGASSALLLKGQVNIYEKTRTDLLRLLQGAENDEREEQTAVPPRRDGVSRSTKEAVQWEYMGNEDKQIHGPYTSEQMRQWISAGYFVGASAVQVRPIFVEEKAEEAATLQDDLMNDLMDDDEDDDGGDHLKPAAKVQVRGEWQQSDRVDFRQFD